MLQCSSNKGQQHTHPGQRGGRTLLSSSLCSTAQRRPSFGSTKMVRVQGGGRQSPPSNERGGAVRLHRAQPHTAHTCHVGGTVRQVYPPAPQQTFEHRRSTCRRPPGSAELQAAACPLALCNRDTHYRGALGPLFEATKLQGASQGAGGAEPDQAACTSSATTAGGGAGGGRAAAQGQCCLVTRTLCMGIAVQETLGAMQLVPAVSCRAGRP